MENKTPFIAGMTMTTDQKMLARLERIRAALPTKQSTAVMKQSTAVMKQNKKKKPAVYNFTLEQIEEIKRQTIRDAVKELIELTLGLPIMVLHDKHNWPKEENSQFVDDVMYLYDSYERGYITLEDVRDALWEEAETRVQRRDATVTLRGGKR
jgi:hypothetical protein